MDWRIKGLVQGVLAKTPGGGWLNDRLQVIAGGRRRVGPHVASKVNDDWAHHMAMLTSHGVMIEGATLVEIGSGWLPILPLCFALAGAARIVSFDLHRHLAPGAARRALLSLQAHLRTIASASGAAPNRVAERFRDLMDAPPARLLERAGIDYRAPADASQTGLEDASIDLVFSNSVLEHMPQEVLDAIMAEGQRILRRSGFALHGVNCGDHYAYFDRSITPINYLRYSDARWRIWNNDILFQNRLRAGELVASATRAGLEIVADRRTMRHDLLQVLPEFPLADRFRSYPAEELCCTSIDFLARPARTPAIAAHSAQGER